MKADTRHPSAASYAIVLAMVVALVVYGSLYPFVFRPREYPGGAIGYLLASRRAWDGRGDLLSNILLYMPLGFFAVCAVPRRVALPLRTLLAIVLGAALSTAMELSQFHDIGRVTSLGDVYANTIGAGAGAVVGLAGGGIRWNLVRALGRHPPAGMLLAAWLGYRLYPYVSEIDLHKYWRAIGPALHGPAPTPLDLLRFTLAWLLLGRIIEAVYGVRRSLLLFPLVFLFELLGQVMIVERAVKPADGAGFVLAFVLWLLVLRVIPGRDALLALALAVLILILRLEPFRFAAMPQAFHFVPFVSLMNGSIGVAIQAFCEKFYLYGGLIWVLNRAEMGWAKATILVALLLFATSAAEIWLPSRSAETGDGAMALVIGGVFALLGGPSTDRRKA